MERVLVSGSLAYDRIMNFPGLFEEHIVAEKTHAISVSFGVDNLKESYGGCAGNIAYTLALLREKPCIVARAGNDFASYRSWLQKNSIDTSLIEEDADVSTSFANIITDQKNNQIAAFYRGAGQKAYPYTDTILQGDIAIVSAGNPDDMRALPSLLRKKNIPFIFDPGQAITALSDDDIQNGIQGAQALIVNDYELSIIKKKTSLSEGDIRDRVEIFVTTLGAEGSRIQKGEETVLVPAAKAHNTNDPTGAGDAYRAGFIVGLMHEWPLLTIGKFAGVVACYTVETYGTQTHHFITEEVRERYKENFGEYPPMW